MTFLFRTELGSTQKYLLSLVSKGEIHDDTILVARHQSSGIGSRGGTWESVESGLYMSLAVHDSSLPCDLPMQSVSIYFGVVFLRIFRRFNESVWLKWPNDFYLGPHKIGGIMSNIRGPVVIVGLGLNLFSTSRCCLSSSDIYYPLLGDVLSFCGFDVPHDTESSFSNDLHLHIDGTLRGLEAYSWKDVFELYRAEFGRNSGFTFHGNGKTLSFSDAILGHDGSVLLDGTVFYSLR